MNAILNKLLLVGDKFMPEIYLKQPGFTYSVCGPFTKNKERMQKKRSRRFKIYLSKLIRWGWFSEWYSSLWISMWSCFNDL